MPFFSVTYVHPDVKLWSRHRDAHVEYLKDLLRDGVLRASGPFRDTPAKSALIILVAESRDAAHQIIAADPFQIHGIVEETVVTEWDPIFGAFSSDPCRTPLG